MGVGSGVGTGWCRCATREHRHSPVPHTLLDKLRQAETLNQDHELLLYQRIQLSYDALVPIDRRLQKCFLYFAAFPEDEVIKVEYLVDLWAGEGILHHNEYHDVLPDAYFLLGVLMGRSLIELSFQSNWYMRLHWVQIHDVLRDYALYTIQHNKEVYAYVSFTVVRFSDFWLEVNLVCRLSCFFFE